MDATEGDRAMMQTTDDYSADIRSADTERARSTVAVQMYPEGDTPLAVDFSGTCPRCHHSLASERRWLIAVAGAASLDDQQRQAIIAELRDLDIDLSKGDETFDLTCSCTVDHPKHPDGKKGCGATYRVRVGWSQ